MSALLLKIIACTTMFLDHVGYFWRIDELRIIGRLAFPIFVYLIYNGYRHTSSKLKYALRLIFFAIATQIPFDLFSYGVLWSNKGNVFFTLLAALLAVWSLDTMIKHKVLRWFCLVPTAALCGLYWSGLFSSDYNAKGILLILVFYFCDRKNFGWKLLMIPGFFLAIYHGYLLSHMKQLCLLIAGMEYAFRRLSAWEITQAWSALSLPLIFIYNGKKGPAPKNASLAKLMQFGFYLFYPLHMVFLWFLSIL